MQKKVCKSCGVEKSVLDFYKQSNKDYFRPYCKECYSKNNAKYHKDNYSKIKVSQKKYYNSNKKKILDYLSDWRKNNASKVKTYEKKSRDNHKKEKLIWTNNRRMKIRGLGGSFTLQEWAGVLDKYNHTCLCCGRKDLKLSPDHVIPVSKGGSNTIDNIQPLCISCNCKKNDKYIDYRGNYE